MYVRQKRVDPSTDRPRYEAVESFRTPQGPRQRVLATWSGGWRTSDGTPVPEEPLATLAATIHRFNHQVARLTREQEERARMWAERGGLGVHGMNRTRDNRIAHQIAHWEKRLEILDGIADRLRAAGA